MARLVGAATAKVDRARAAKVEKSMIVEFVREEDIWDSVRRGGGCRGLGDSEDLNERNRCLINAGHSTKWQKGSKSDQHPRSGRAIRQGSQVQK